VSKKYKAAKSIKKLGVAKTINLKKKAKVSAKTEVKFKKANKAGGKKIIVAKDGTGTVKNGLKRGTYKVKVKLTAPADANYKKAKAKTITLKITVK
jgi:predicted GTPase